jgi:hypothetical protein
VRGQQGEVSPTALWQHGMNRRHTRGELLAERPLGRPRVRRPAAPTDVP